MDIAHYLTEKKRNVKFMNIDLFVVDFFLWMSFTGKEN